MKVAIIGAGHVGASLGKGWARAGHAITFGVIDPTDPGHAVPAAAAGGARLAPVADCGASADVIVLAVPWDAVAAAIAELGDLSGQLVIDATNPLRMGTGGLELALGFSTSGGEEVARLAPGASVFKAMNQVGFAVMSDTAGYPARPVIFVAGDDAERKPQVLALVTDLGFEAVDAGPLDRARLLEPYAMLWIDQALSRGAPADNAFAFMRKQAGPGAVEYIRYVLDVHDGTALTEAYALAAPHLQAAPECLGYDLAQCDEDPASFILRIHWLSAHAHMDGFRRGPHFPPFLAAIRDFLPEIAEMRHYTPTAISWRR